MASSAQDANRGGLSEEPPLPNNLHLDSETDEELEELRTRQQQRLRQQRQNPRRPLAAMSMPTLIHHAIARERVDSARQRTRMEGTLVQRMDTIANRMRTEMNGVNTQVEQAATQLQRIEAMLRQITPGTRPDPQADHGADLDPGDDRDRDLRIEDQERDQERDGRRELPIGQNSFRPRQPFPDYNQSRSPFPQRDNPPPHLTGTAAQSGDRSLSRERETAAMSEFLRTRPPPRDESCRRTNGRVVDGTYQRDPGAHTYPLRIENDPNSDSHEVIRTLQPTLTRNPNCSSNESRLRSQDSYSPPRGRQGSSRNPDGSRGTDPQTEPDGGVREPLRENYVPRRHSRSPPRHSPQRRYSPAVLRLAMIDSLASKHQFWEKRIISERGYTASSSGPAAATSVRTGLKLLSKRWTPNRLTKSLIV